MPGIVRLRKRDPSMAKSQIDEIKELEASIRELLKTNAEVREVAKTVSDQPLRETLLKAADEGDESVRRMLDALRGMRESLH